MTEDFLLDVNCGHNDGECLEDRLAHMAGEPMDSVPEYTYSISADYSFGLPVRFRGHVRADYMASDDIELNIRGFGYSQESVTSEGLEKLNLLVGAMRGNWSVHV